MSKEDSELIKTATRIRDPSIIRKEIIWLRLILSYIYSLGTDSDTDPLSG